MKRGLTKELREFIPLLQKNGFTYARTNGNHDIYINRTTHRHISVNRKLNRMVRERLIKENNLEE